MNNIPTLFNLLQDSDIQLSMVEMGRRIEFLSPKLMQQFEQFEAPYPAPLAQQAWFALLQQQTNSDDSIVWFLRYPLDENAKLQPAAREYMSNRLAEVSIHKNNTDALKDNPYIFKPKTDRLALFHAVAANRQGQEPSSHYEHALAYFSGKLGWNQWSFVGYQGIAEIAVRANQKDISNALITALPQLPEQPLVALCHCLESAEISDELQSFIFQQISTHKTNPTLSSAFIRALSGNTLFNAQLQQICSDQNIMSQPECLAAITAKGWRWLYNAELSALVLEALANTHPTIFNQLTSDLMFIPDLKARLVSYIKSDKSTAMLKGRLDALLQQGVN